MTTIIMKKVPRMVSNIGKPKPLGTDVQSEMSNLYIIADDHHCHYHC